MESDGFEVPVHRSLTEPLLMAGAPFRPALANVLLSVSLGFGGQSYLALPLGATIHMILVMLTKVDPNFFALIKRNMVRSNRWRV